MALIRTTIEWIGYNGTRLMPLGIIIGVLVQPLAHLLFPLLPFTVYVMLTIVLARLDVERALAHLRRPKVFIISLIYGFVVLPTALSLIAVALPLSPGLTAALVVYGTAPPNYAAAALAFVMGLDGALTVATNPFVRSRSAGRLPKGRSGDRSGREAACATAHNTRHAEARMGIQENRLAGRPGVAEE